MDDFDSPIQAIAKGGAQMRWTFHLFGLLLAARTGSKRLLRSGIFSLLGSRVTSNSLFFLVISMAGTTARAEPSGASVVADGVLRAALAREQGRCAFAGVEFRQVERLTAEGAKTRGFQHDGDEVRMERSIAMQFGQDGWHYSMRGDAPYSLHAGEGPTVIRKISLEYVNQNDRALQFVSIEGITDGRGNVQTVPDGFVEPYGNQPDHLPVLLFARPSRTQLLTWIRAGDLEGARGADGGVRLIHRLSRTREFCFDSSNEVLPLSMNLAGPSTLSIEYANFPGFGMAPSAWTYTQFREERIISFTTCDVQRWYTNKVEVQEGLAYWPPAGSDILDLDAKRMTKSGDSGELLSTPGQVQSRGFRGTHLALLGGAVLIAIAVAWRRLKKRHSRAASLTT